MGAGLPSYISVARLTEQAGEPYAWGVFDAYPSADMGRAPMLWGIAKDASHLSVIASRYGLGHRLKMSASHDVNADIRDRASCPRALCTAHRGTFAYWPRRLDWLYHRPPAYIAAGLSPKGLAALADRYCQQHGVGRSTSSYLVNYQLAQAARHINRPKPTATRIELIYSSASSQAPSQAHLIVGITRDHIVIDRLPFYAGGFLLPGWAGYALYTVKLKRSDMDARGEARDRATGLTFYMPSQAHLFPRHADHQHQLDDDLEDDDVGYDHSCGLIELPASSLQWAIETLSLLCWPADPHQLKRAYRSALQRAHPDKGGTAEQFMQVKAAYAYIAALSKPAI